MSVTVVASLSQLMFTSSTVPTSPLSILTIQPDGPVDTSAPSRYEGTTRPNSPPATVANDRLIGPQHSKPRQLILKIPGQMMLRITGHTVSLQINWRSSLHLNPSLALFL
jgi:hypothetical protein